MPVGGMDKSRVMKKDRHPQQVKVRTGNTLRRCDTQGSVIYILDMSGIMIGVLGKFVREPGPDISLEPGNINLLFGGACNGCPQ